MRTIGFVNSHKENERRIALLPEDLDKLSDIASQIVFEKGYASRMGVSDEEYLSRGAKILSREEILNKCDIICDPKAGDAEYLEDLQEGRTIFGWVHPHVCENVKNLLLKKHFEVYAWEEMMEDGMQVFYRNNELAGEAAVNHGCQCCGILPEGKKAAVIGRGNTAQGAIRALVRGGAYVTVYGRKNEEKLRKDIGQYDIIVNAVLWDPKRTVHIISRKELRQAKQQALLVDVSCDEHGAVETSRPTDYAQPTFVEEGVIHYCVDHTPSIYYREASKFISSQVKRFIRPLVTGETDEVLESGCVIRNGEMILEESCR